MFLVHISLDGTSPSVFMMNDIPSGTAKVPNQKVARRPKYFSFFFLRQASSNLHDSFTMVFTQNSSIFYWAVHQPIAIFQGLKSPEVVWTTQQSVSVHYLISLCYLCILAYTAKFSWKKKKKNHGFLFDAIFYLRVRMRTNHLAMKCNYCARLLN